MTTAILDPAPETTSINTKNWPASKIKRVFFIVAIALPILLLVGAIVPQYYTSFVGTPAEDQSLLDKYRSPLLTDKQWDQKCADNLDAAFSMAHTNIGPLLCGCIVAVCGLYFKWYGNLWNNICKKYPHRGETFRSFIFLAIMSLLFTTLTFQFFIGKSVFDTVMLSFFFQFVPGTLFYILSRKRISSFFGALISVIFLLFFLEGFYNISLIFMKMSSKPLEENANSQELFQLADRLGFPRELIRLSIIGPATIKTLFGEVILMTELSMITPRYAAAVFAHEYQHTQQSLVIRLLSTLSHEVFKYFSAAFVASSPIFFEMFGFLGEPLIAAPFISEVLLFPIELVLISLRQFIIRMYEYDSDNLAIKLGYGTELIGALTVLTPHHYTHPIFEALYSTHPCIVNRLKSFLSTQ